MTFTTDTDPDHLLAWSIFGQEELDQLLEVEKNQSRFVHYTSAEVAVSILKRQEVWMRRPQLMNDFQEIEWGSNCLRQAWHSPAGEQLRAELDMIFSELSDRVAKTFDGLLPAIRSQTFMTCVSQHDDGEEDYLGRLSMWRAYGGDAGVALVIRSHVFTSNSDVLNTYTHPVFYHRPSQVEDRFRQVSERIRQNRTFLISLGEELTSSYIHDFFTSVVMCTKHPGFKEEKEWRIIHNAHPNRSPNLEYRHEVVRGIPQQIVALPLKDHPENGLIGAALPSLIDRVIVGPNEFAWETRAVFRDLLEAAQIPDPDNRLYVSDIPVRQRA